MASPVAEVSSVQLARWRVYETSDGHRHFAGHNVRRGTGRASTAIVAYDRAGRRGSTESGRIYELIGDPAVAADPDAEYVWSVWRALNGVIEYRDVTDEYLGGQVPPSLEPSDPRSVP